MTDGDLKFDVVIVTDLRFVGGNSSSVAEEIRAQAAAGYRTGLIHVASPTNRRLRPFNEKILRALRAGWAELIPARQHVDASLLVLRHPTVIHNLDAHEFPISARHRIIVANQIPREGDRIHYDVREADARFTATYGAATWAPIGPLMREYLEPHRADIRVAPEDWLNIIDVDDWTADRSKPVGDRPVVGRHSRDHKLKWPATVDSLLAAYPDDPAIGVRILGGADSVGRMLGHIPDSWVVEPYAVDGPRTFLRSIDFFVYFHHPDLTEAFGRSIFEALASGAVAIVPRHYRPLFGDSCLYAEPHDVRGIVESYFGDWDRYLEQSQRGVAYARERFGHAVHVQRVSDLIGAGRGPLVSTSSHTAASPRCRRVLFMSSNGAGVGHLTRLMAMARKRSSDVDAVFFTLSQGIRWVEEVGFPVEYLGSQKYLAGGAPNPRWNELLRSRLEALIDLYRPDGLVFDGTQPYRGLLDTLSAHPEVVAIWSRRAMWKPEISKNLSALSEHFQLILEPGELADVADVGLTASHRHEATLVDPITFLDIEDVLPRDPARAELGISDETLAVLVQLGAGNINDTEAAFGAAVATLTELGAHIFVSDSAISDRDLDGGNVRKLNVYPLSRYLRAFDFVIGAAGYNLFHELLGFGVASLLVPNAQTDVDDQVGRARYAARQGAALIAYEDDPVSVSQGIQQLADPARRELVRARATALARSNGAATAMAAIEAAIGVRTSASR